MGSFGRRTPTIGSRFVARRTLTRPGALWRAALGLSGIALVWLAGCGVSETGNTDRGRQLFVQKCGSCHVLKQAATTGTQGPDLDAAFAQARASGMDPDTIAGVVKAQVDNPRPSTDDPSVSMPAHLVEGEELDDVATYVAQVAGVPGIKPPTFAGGPGGQIFGLNGCAGCHTFKAAGSTATTGPDLDKVLAGQSAAEIKQSIVDPNAKIAPGYPPGVMPQNFGQTISPKDLNTLIKFLQQGAGGQGN
jgi:mono/diheme cytochrome c family protein